MRDVYNVIEHALGRASQLRGNARNRESKALYAKLMTYCLLVRDHLRRIDSARLTLKADLTNSLAAKFQAVDFSTLATAEGAIQDLLEFLVTWEDDVNAQYPDDCSWSAEDYAPMEKKQDAPLSVSKPAKTVFNVLSSCQDCTCDPAHDYGARLRLGTYHKPSLDDGDDDGDGVSFDMFLSAMQDWQEARVYSARERAIQFAVIGTEAATAQTARGRAKKRVECLCEPIFKIRNKAACRLELEVERGQLFKLQSKKGDQLVDLSQTPVSLDEFLQGGPRSFTEKTKRILMVLLSYAVLHLHDTPWLQSTWNSTNVIFFQGRDSEMPLRPFLDTGLSSRIQTRPDTAPDADRDENEDVDPDDVMQHPCPTMITLAVMLMEIFFVTTFDELARQFNVEITGEAAGLFQHLDADMVFKACKSEIPENSQFLDVVDKCLNPTTWKDEDDATLDCQELRAVMYEEVVRPLENDLRQAYSSISIRDLDRFAQSLDMSCWDRTIRHRQMDEKLAVKLRVGLKRNTSPLPDHSSQHGDRFISKSVIRVPNDQDHDDLKFFDDEDASGNQSGDYIDWKAKYFAVYHKSITPYMELAPKRVKIAVLDTGVDLNHPEIQAYDENIKAKRNFLDNGSKGTGDYEGHGTFVTALLLEYAPDADIYVGKVSAGKELASPGIIAKAIQHAVYVWQVDMISMSFGYPKRDIAGYNELEEALKHADLRNVLLFAAASNSGGRLGRAFPARERSVICVHSTKVNGDRSDFSPTPIKSSLNLATVGEDIRSAWPEHLCEGDAVAIKSGTSFATPIMVGVAALLLTYIRLHVPDRVKAVTQRSMENLLRRIAQKGPDAEERDGYWFVDLSLFNDSLFGKEKGFIDSTIRDILNS